MLVTLRNLQTLLSYQREGQQLKPERRNSTCNVHAESMCEVLSSCFVLVVLRIRLIIILHKQFIVNFCHYEQQNHLLKLSEFTGDYYRSL